MLWLFGTKSAVMRLHRRSPINFAALLLALLPAFISSAVGADIHTFSNNFISFHLPDSWDCDLEQTEWVCNETRGSTHPSIAIIAAKQAGPDDTLDAYFDHLARRKMLRNDAGQPLRMSVVQSLRREVIGAQTWVTSTQFESELPDFYTEYYATVKDDIAVLFTLSAHKTVYRGLAATFRDIVSSLQVFDPSGSSR